MRRQTWRWCAAVVLIALLLTIDSADAAKKATKIKQRSLRTGKSVRDGSDSHVQDNSHDGGGGGRGNSNNGGGGGGGGREGEGEREREERREGNNDDRRGGENNERRGGENGENRDNGENREDEGRPQRVSTRLDEFGHGGFLPMHLYPSFQNLTEILSNDTLSDVEKFRHLLVEIVCTRTSPHTEPIEEGEEDQYEVYKAYKKAIIDIATRNKPMQTYKLQPIDIARAEKYEDGVYYFSIMDFFGASLALINAKQRNPDFDCRELLAELIELDALSPLGSEYFLPDTPALIALISQNMEVIDLLGEKYSLYKPGAPAQAVDIAQVFQAKDIIRKLLRYQCDGYPYIPTVSKLVDYVMEEKANPTTLAEHVQSVLAEASLSSEQKDWIVQRLFRLSSIFQSLPIFKLSLQITYAYQHGYLSEVKTAADILTAASSVSDQDIANIKLRDAFLLIHTAIASGDEEKIYYLLDDVGLDINEKAAGCVPAPVLLYATNKLHMMDAFLEKGWRVEELANPSPCFFSENVAIEAPWFHLITNGAPAKTEIKMMKRVPEEDRHHYMKQLKAVKHDGTSLDYDILSAFEMRVGRAIEVCDVEVLELYSKENMSLIFGVEEKHSPALMLFFRSGIERCTRKERMEVLKFLVEQAKVDLTKVDKDGTSLIEVVFKHATKDEMQYLFDVHLREASNMEEAIQEFLLSHIHEGGSIEHKVRDYAGLLDIYVNEIRNYGLDPLHSIYELDGGKRHRYDRQTSADTPPPVESTAVSQLIARSPQEMGSLLSSMLCDCIYTLHGLAEMVRREEGDIIGKDIDMSQFEHMLSEFTTSTRLGCEGLRTAVHKVRDSSMNMYGADVKKAEKMVLSALNKEGDATKQEENKEKEKARQAWPAVFHILKLHLPSLKQKEIGDLSSAQIAFLQRLVLVLDDISKKTETRCLDPAKQKETRFGMHYEL